MNDLIDILPFLIAPGVVLVLSSSLAAWRIPGPKVRSALQHFAAGIIFASVATEIVPELLAGGFIVRMLVGFLVGILLIFGVRLLDNAGEGSGDDASRQRYWFGLAVAAGIDLFIDGFLMGIGFGVAHASGLLLTFAISFEVLFLGFTLSMTIRSRGLGRLGVLVLMFGMAALLPLGGIVGHGVFSALDPGWQAAALSFGSVALLYLVTEELLVEAHESGETSLGSLLFFVGFGASLVAAMSLS